MIFASVATLGRVEYLNENYFAPDYFTYVVIDEFHHAVNEQYKRIVDYFKPKFLLGLTATPERMDGKNIYEICDYNVPYEISLKDGTPLLLNSFAISSACFLEQQNPNARFEPYLQ